MTQLIMVRQHMWTERAGVAAASAGVTTRAGLTRVAAGHTGHYQPTGNPKPTTPRAAENDAAGATNDGNGAFRASNIYCSIPNVLSNASAFSPEFWVLTSQTGDGRGDGTPGSPSGVPDSVLSTVRSRASAATSGRHSPPARSASASAGDTTIYGPFSADGSYHHIVATWVSGDTMTIYATA